MDKQWQSCSNLQWKCLIIIVVIYSQSQSMALLIPPALPTRRSQSTFPTPLPDVTCRTQQVHYDIERRRVCLHASQKQEDSRNKKNEKKREKAAKENKSSKKGDATSSGWIFRLLSDKDKDKGEKKKKKAEKSKDDGDNESRGLLRSIFSSNKEEKEAKAKAKKEKELLDILTKELDSSEGDTFEAPNIAAAFEQLEEALIQARNELAGIRPQPLSEEEKRLQELRIRAEKERQNQQGRIEAQKLARQQSTERQVKQIKEIAERIAASEERISRDERVRETAATPASKTSKSEQQKRDDKKTSEKKKKKKNEDSSSKNEEKRSNPLSVAQKFISNFRSAPSEVEQWIPVAKKTRISPGELVPVNAAGLDLLLVASKDGSALHCIANSCPHLGTPLETGMQERRPIETSTESSNNSNMVGEKDGKTDFQETDIVKMLAQDGCEDCIVCPLHKTAFALESGEVRGEWCPYPPVLGKVMGTVKQKDTLPVFDVRTRGKNIEVRLNTPVE